MADSAQEPTVRIKSKFGHEAVVMESSLKAWLSQGNWEKVQEDTSKSESTSEEKKKP